MRTLLMMLLMGLLMVGNACNRSTEKSQSQPVAVEEGKALENKVIGEVKNVEQDMKVAEEEKVVEKKMGKELDKLPPPEADWGNEPESPEAE